MSEAYVQLPPDSIGKSIRLIQVAETQPDGTVATVYQEAVVLADEDGNLVLVGGLGKKALPVENTAIVERLDRLTVGLAHLLLLLKTVSRPRVPIRELDEWLDTILD